MAQAQTCTRWLALGLALGLSACAPRPASTPGYPAPETLPAPVPLRPYPVPPTLIPPPASATPSAGFNRPAVGTPVAEPAIHAQARRHLAERLMVSAPTIIIMDSQAVDWPDSCLGVYGGYACLDVITPGYIITAQVGAQTYVLHSNANGSVFQLAQPAVADLAQAAITAARQALAERFNQPAEAFTLVASEEVTWPDGCLGVYESHIACTTLMVPGFRLTFAHNGQTTLVHTDFNGALVKIVPHP